MKQKLPGICRDLWRKAPYNVERFFLEYAEGSLGERLQRKVLSSLERRIGQFDLLDVGKAEQAVVSGAIAEVVANEIVATAIEKAIQTS